MPSLARQGCLFSSVCCSVWLSLRRFNLVVFNLVFLVKCCLIFDNIEHNKSWFIFINSETESCSWWCNSLHTKHPVNESIIRFYLFWAPRPRIPTENSCHLMNRTLHFLLSFRRSFCKQRVRPPPVPAPRGREGGHWYKMKSWIISSTADTHSNHLITLRTAATLQTSDVWNCVLEKIICYFNLLRFPTSNASDVQCAARISTFWESTPALPYFISHLHQIWSS